MNNVLIIEMVVNKVLQEIQFRYDLSKEPKDIYKRMSMDLNMAGIDNKIINTLDLYGINDYYFILIDIKENIDEYMLIDLNSKNKFEKIDDYNSSMYYEKIAFKNKKIKLFPLQKSYRSRSRQFLQHQRYFLFRLLKTTRDPLPDHSHTATHNINMQRR